MPRRWVWLKKYPEGTYIFVNDAFCIGSGLQKENIIGKTDLDLWPDEYARHFLNRDQAVVQSGKPIIVKEYTPGAHAERRLVETTKFPILDNGVVVAVAGIARDVQWEDDLAHYIQQSVEELEKIVRG
jgi:PAS domain S-box-containing protein